jgi:hypothetical protein
LFNIYIVGTVLAINYRAVQAHKYGFAVFTIDKWNGWQPLYCNKTIPGHARISILAIREDYCGSAVF